MNVTVTFRKLGYRSCNEWQGKEELHVFLATPGGSENTLSLFISHEVAKQLADLLYGALARRPDDPNQLTLPFKEPA
jgi:hypothetical protein